MSLHIKPVLKLKEKQMVTFALFSQLCICSTWFTVSIVAAIKTTCTVVLQNFLQSDTMHLQNVCLLDNLTQSIVQVFVHLHCVGQKLQ